MQNLTGADVTALYDDETVWPKGFDPDERGAVHVAPKPKKADAVHVAPEIPKKADKPPA